MLKLVICEFAKLKRRRLFKIALFTSVLYPAFFSALVSMDDLGTIAGTAREEGGFLLLIPILAIMAASLFFEEHDYDTLKNLVCVPVLKSHIVMAKIFVLLLFSITYELAGYVFSILLAVIQGVPTDDWALQLFLTFCTGVLLWAAALPCMILVVWCNKSYIISVIIAFFYTLLGYVMHLSDVVMMKPLGLNINTLIPVPIIFRWLYQFKIPKGEITADFYRRFSLYFVSTPVVFMLLLSEAAVCILLIIKVYQKQES